MKKICFVSSCYNEEDNVENLYQRVVEAFEQYKEKYEFSYILLDNCSTDGTQKKLRELAASDKRVKVIINARNFGHIRSPYYGIINSDGDATIYLASDLQDPPELIPDFIKKWEEGYKIVLGKEIRNEEGFIMSLIRELYYKTIKRFADDNTELAEHCSGFGLFDKVVTDIIRQIDDPYPYIRGLVCEIGFEKAFIEYSKPLRKKGITKNNFYTLYDNAMLGIVKHSKVPLRLATFAGFILSGISMLVALFYFVYKLLFWNTFNVGQAPLVIGLFFFASVQLFFIGIVGEYVGAIYTRVDKKPVVVPKEKINF